MIIFEITFMIKINNLINNFLFIDLSYKID